MYTVYPLVDQGVKYGVAERSWNVADMGAGFGTATL